MPPISYRRSHVLGMNPATPLVMLDSALLVRSWFFFAFAVASLLDPSVVRARPPVLPPAPSGSDHAQPDLDAQTLELQRPRAPTRESEPEYEDLQPTSSPAPPSRLASPPTPAETAPRRTEIVATERGEEPTSKHPIAHRGFILDAAAGTLGCTGAICNGRGGYDAAPGVFAGGFIGGNIGGFVELGVKGGWGRMQSRASNGEHAVSYWGVTPGDLEHELDAHGGVLRGPMVDTLAHARSHDTKLSAFHAAPMLRLHFAPRGRAIVFVGVGAGYGGLRSDHRTDRGPLQLSAHGLAVPLEGGLGVHISSNVALIARFDYVWMHYLLLAIDDRSDTMVLPTSMVDKLPTSRRSGTQDSLPHFWTVSLGLRLRLF
jgi:hypothetical protein